MADQDTQQRDQSAEDSGATSENAEQGGSGEGQGRQQGQEQSGSGGSGGSGNGSDNSGSGNGSDDSDGSGSSSEKSEKSGSDKSEKSGSEKSDESEKSGSEGSDKSDSGESGSSSDESSSGEEAPARRSDSHPRPQEPSDEDRKTQDAGRSSFLRGDRDEDGEGRRSSVDVSDLIWRGAGILATLIRIVTLVFAAVLVIDVVLTVVGVNPANGVARFMAGFADTVVLGFRDLFLPADPTLMLVINYGLAAVFWVVVGGFLSSGLRFVAARIS